MDRPEPQMRDRLINRGRQTRIAGFSEDEGTRLFNGEWVCISEFEMDSEGVWRRPGEVLADLEMPVGPTAPDDLAEAVLLLRQDPSRVPLDHITAELLATVLDAWHRMGRVDPGVLNRVAGPETVRLARHIANPPS